MTVPTGRVLRPIISDDELAKQQLADEIAAIAEEYVDGVYDAIREAEKANENKPMGHYLLRPEYVPGKENAASKDKTSFYEWKRPGNRQASKVKRYPRFCEV